VSALREGRLRGARRLRDGHVLYWWLEIIAVVVFYLVYSAIRNANESGATIAFGHAREIIRVQRALGINVEETIQDWALGWRPVIVFSNYFYGSLHFVVTAGAAIFLYRRWPNDYPRWRNTLGVATAIALIGFVAYPLMPPRLLPGSYGFVDTLQRYPTLWSFNSGAMSRVSNQYAAMPSVHCAWALWCACVFFPRVRSPWARIAAVAYPTMTVAVIVITGNHYLVDAPAGFACLGIGYLVAHRFTRAGRGEPVLADDAVASVGASTSASPSSPSPSSPSPSSPSATAPA